MSASTNAAPARPYVASAVVIGPQFNHPYPIDLFFTTEGPGMSKGRLAALNDQGKLLFQVNALEDQRIICDAAGNPLVTERYKRLTLHNRRRVFKGESEEENDMLFIVKKSSAFQFSKKYDVILASNTNGDVCDYKIKGKYKKRSCSIYKGESSFVVVQHLTLHNRRRVFRGESEEENDILFIVKESSAFQFSTKYDVILASNTKGDVCDYKIKGKYKKRSCSIYKGESSFLVAQMSKEKTNFPLGKKGFKVSVSPNIDYAFIATLIFILHQIKQEEDATKGIVSAEAAGAATEVAVNTAFSAGSVM